MLSDGLPELGAGLPNPPIVRPRVSRVSTGRTAFGLVDSRVVGSSGGSVPWHLCTVITWARLRKWVAGVELACPASPRRSGFGAGGVPLREPTPATKVVRSGGGFVLRRWLKINTLVRDQSWVAGVELACPASPRRSGFGAGGVSLWELTPATQVVWLGGGFVSQNQIVVAS